MTAKKTTGKFDSIEAALRDIARGKMVVVVDDADRENEGDLIMAAEKATAKAVNFMAKFGRGLICVPTAPERLQQLGIERMVLNNRPDGEAADQPSSEEMAIAAEAAGLAYAHQPVVGNNISDIDIDGFDAIVSLADAPVLAFCRTGTRCTTLWALTQADEQDNASILTTAEQAGYDLSQLAGRLDQRRGQ